MTNPWHLAQVGSMSRQGDVRCPSQQLLPLHLWVTLSLCQGIAGSPLAAGRIHWHPVQQQQQQCLDLRLSES
jgi:hypothetical protein